MKRTPPFRPPVVALIALAGGLWLSGCTTGSLISRQPSVALPHQMLLLIPSEAQDQEPDGRTGFAAYCRDEAAAVLDGNLVYGPDQTELKPMITRDNLAPAGVFDQKELMAMCRTTACPSVAAICVVRRRELPPQRLVAQAIWCTEDDVRGPRRITFVLDLSREGTRELFEDYIKRTPSLWAQLGITEEDDLYGFQTDTGRLSPDAFNRFAAAWIVRRLLTSPPDAIRDQVKIGEND